MRETLSLGEYTRRLRRRKDLNLANVAEATGVSISHLSRIENDAVVPSPETVVKLAEALDGDLNEMLQLAECLPREILERLTRRTSQGERALRRTAGEQADRGYAGALIADMDPQIRRVIAEHFAVPEDDASALFEALRQLSLMTREQREVAMEAISLMAKGARS